MVRIMSKVFISYRRADSNDITGRIYDRFVNAFGENNVFKDVNNILAGRDFRSVLRDVATSCDIMLVIIGPTWIDITNNNGIPRLDEPDDFVRLEVEIGLQRNDVLVVPVLVNGAVPPQASQLPPSLQQLAYNHAFSVRNDPNFHTDISRLIKQLKGNYWKWVLRVALLIFVFVLLIVAIYPTFFSNHLYTPTPNQTELTQIADNPTSTYLLPTDTPTLTLTDTQFTTSSSEIRLTKNSFIISTVTPSVEKLIIANFDNSSNINNLGKEMGVFVLGTDNNYIVETYENGEAKITYTFVDNGYGGFYIRLDRTDFSLYNMLTFDISASSKIYFRVELQDTQHEYLIYEQVAEPSKQNISISLDQINLLDLTNISELIFVIEQSNAGTTGTITIDNIILR